MMPSMIIRSSILQVLNILNEDQFIDIQFLREVNGKLKQQATYAKMTRGAFISYMAKNHIEEIEDLKGFDELGFKFDQELSHDSCYVFVQSEGK